MAVQTGIGQETIKVPKIHYVEGREFYAGRVDKALALVEQGVEGIPYRALFMPELVDTLIAAPFEASVWQGRYTEKEYITTSIEAIGKTKQGNAVVVYDHLPNYLSISKNVTKAMEQGLVDDRYPAVRMPQKEFQALLDRDGEKDEDGNRLTWVCNYDKLERAGSDFVFVDRVLEHPQMIPFMGGEERAEAFLKRYTEIRADMMKFEFSGKGLSDEPLVRMLSLSDYHTPRYPDFNGAGRFIAIRKDPSLEDRA